jgi:alpha-D-ribose 1-methylphosphonate 5-triphosphate synthase subunit PhnG
VDALCHVVATRRAEREDREWAELAPTIVAFEDLA